MSDPASDFDHDFNMKYLSNVLENEESQKEHLIGNITRNIPNSKDLGSNLLKQQKEMLMETNREQLKFNRLGDIFFICSPQCQILNYSLFFLP